MFCLQRTIISTLQVPGSNNLVVVRQNRVNLNRNLQKRNIQKNLALLPPVGNNSKSELLYLSL